MNKSIIIFLLTFLTFSCTDTKMENVIVEIEALKAENDSLKQILQEVNEKYVFDSIAIRDIPSYKNTYKLNSKVLGEIVFVGYNSGNKTNVIMVDSFSHDYNPKRLYNPDTLERKKSGFIYEVELNSDRIYLTGILETKNKFGKDYEGWYKTAFDAIKN